MEATYTIGNINITKTIDPFGNKHLETMINMGDYFEIISNEHPEARTAILEIINYENGYESKAIKKLII